MKDKKNMIDNLDLLLQSGAGNGQGIEKTFKEMAKFGERNEGIEINDAFQKFETNLDKKPDLKLLNLFEELEMAFKSTYSTDEVVFLELDGETYLSLYLEKLGRYEMQIISLLCNRYDTHVTVRFMEGLNLYSVMFHNQELQERHYFESDYDGLKEISSTPITEIEELKKWNNKQKETTA